MKNDFIKPIAVLLIICIAVSGSLSLMNAVTRPIIDEAANERKSAAMRELVPNASDFRVITIENPPKSVVSVYAAYDSGDIKLGYILEISADGYNGSGSIRVLAAVTPGAEITALKTLVNTDTKGMGSRVSGAEFEGKLPGLNAAGVAGTDAVTGATISSNAYKKALIEVLDFISGNIEGAGNEKNE